MKICALLRERADLKLNFKFYTHLSNLLIDRELLGTINNIFRYFSVLTLTGPRQSGKTTLCRKLFASLPYYNLEDVATLDAIKSDPKAFLLRDAQGMILDEAQRFPEIFSYLQVLTDEQRMNGDVRSKYVVTGSANFSLLRNATQSMAGRTAVLTLLPLSNQEINNAFATADTNTRIFKGGYPAVWKVDDAGRNLLLGNYYTTYIERDLRSMINIKDLSQFHTFIRLCAGRIGSECNTSALAVETGVSVPTIQSWLSILEASYVVYRLQPYFANIGKRLTKTPKMYFYDTGLASWLMGIKSVEQLSIHPLRGALFENMVVNDFMKGALNKGERPELYFYRDARQHEVDLLHVDSLGRMNAYEIKSGQTFRSDYFSGLHYLEEVMGDKLNHTCVIYDGELEQQKQKEAYCNYKNITITL